MALSDTAPQAPSPASRQTLARCHQDRASIHDRPKIIESRSEAGHWEGDLIICKCTRPVLVLHERKSRVTLAARLTGKTAAETISAMLAVFGRIDPHLRRSITFDNDTAFAQHGLLRTMRDMTTWFCDAYVSWQKGGIENANGRLLDGCRAISISTAHPTRTSRRSSSRPTSPPQMPRVQDAIPSLAGRAWKGRPNPLLLTSLRFAPESRSAPVQLARPLA